MRVQNMLSNRSGGAVANQFEIFTDKDRQVRICAENDFIQWLGGSVPDVHLLPLQLSNHGGRQLGFRIDSRKIGAKAVSILALR